jgi:hypothetical protein
MSVSFEYRNRATYNASHDIHTSIVQVIDDVDLQDIALRIPDVNKGIKTRLGTIYLVRCDYRARERATSEDRTVKERQIQIGY